MKIKELIDRKLGIIFIFPVVFIMVVLFIYPLLNGFFLSFTYKNLFTPKFKFAGLSHYISIFYSAYYWLCVRNTFVYTFLCVSIGNFLGLGIALLLNQEIKLRGLWRGIFLIPWVTPGVVACAISRWALNDLYGVINYVLINLRIIDKPILWLAASEWAMSTVAMVSIWKGFAFVAVVMLACLQGLPRELQDAASIDGASTWQRFLYITFPMILPLFALITLFTFITTFNMFDIIWLLTKGGPNNATMTLPLLVYEVAFQTYKVGKGLAVAVTMGLYMSIVVFLYFKLLQPRLEYKL